MPRAITVIGCHAGGEVGNVVVAGVDPPPGSSVREQMEALRADDRLRRFLLREPRGSVATHANLIVPATRADCVYGYVIMEPTECEMLLREAIVLARITDTEHHELGGIYTHHKVLYGDMLHAPAGRLATANGHRAVVRNAPRRDPEVDGVRTVTVDVALAACGTQSPTRRRSASSSCPARDLCIAGSDPRRGA